MADLESARRLAVTLDWDAPPQAGDPLPPLWHWLLLTPLARGRELDVDGHPHTGGFLPDLGLPRRMWAGSRVRFDGEVRIGEALERVSIVESVQRKQGRSGALAIVTLRHDYLAGGRVRISEQQDLVYRAAPQPGATAPEPRRPEWTAQFGRSVQPQSTLLFRYSALTFNAHRIHYDRDYAMRVEGYPGLVVQGPLTATLLADAFRQAHPAARVRTLAFRAEAPLFDTAPFSVHGRRDGGAAQLWAQTPAGGLAMSMQLELE